MNENKEQVEYYFKKIYKMFTDYISIYVLWIIIHYISSHLYVKFCTPNTFYGFLLSPFLTSTPYCKGLSWIIYNGNNNITTMWLSLGSWITCKLFFKN